MLKSCSLIHDNCIVEAEILFTLIFLLITRASHALNQVPLLQGIIKSDFAGYNLGWVSELVKTMEPTIYCYCVRTRRVISGMCSRLSNEVIVLLYSNKLYSLKLL